MRHSIVGLLYVQAVTPNCCYCHALCCDFGSVSLHSLYYVKGCDLLFCFIDFGVCYSIGILIKGCDS
ncbi:hypothetical protein CDL12_09802 [Handroanthus impetiginosus]|uniref:Uncharacterized protein n=1 Tax=Handroanthus impetiginosus TaxID=429701 RepID=A0A2G9HJ38_9LAMI|nr:hypothetical protein CDL12_09802 [Handroanthus impetiginosus]